MLGLVLNIIKLGTGGLYDDKKLDLKIRSGIRFPLPLLLCMQALGMYVI